ncbi:MAG: GNAT family N-acetyltransferase [Tepidiformaceae bacterium]
MEYPLRPITDDQVPQFFECGDASFGRDFNEERWRSTQGQYADLDRSLAAWDGNQVVGTTGVWSFELTVPGGSLPTAGVTWVAVRPTHRRQGLLTAIMRRQLDDVHERGESLAALWATEAPIYGRFGYGCAAEGVEMQIERPYSGLKFTVPGSGRTRFVTREQALEVWPAFYEDVRLSTPGMISRDKKWWSHRHLPEAEPPLEGFSKQRLVQYEEDGSVIGYVRYQVRADYVQGSAASELRVRELIADGDSAYSALWQFVFGVDLIKTIHAEWRRVDEPLVWMLNDPRRLIRRTQDTLFVRLVDAAEALAGRHYSTEDELVIGLRDTFCEWNTGAYLLKAGPGGATCSRTNRTPDITLETEALGAAYLGGVRFSTLAQAGRVEGSAALLRRADAMFAWQPLPWIPEIF